MHMSRADRQLSAAAAASQQEHEDFLVTSGYVGADQANPFTVAENDWITGCHVDPATSNRVILTFAHGISLSVFDICTFGEQEFPGAQRLLRPCVNQTDRFSVTKLDSTSGGPSPNPLVHVSFRLRGLLRHPFGERGVRLPPFGEKTFVPEFWNVASYRGRPESVLTVRWSDGRMVVYPLGGE